MDSLERTGSTAYDSFQRPDWLRERTSRSRLFMNEGIHPIASLLAAVARLISGVQVQWAGCEPSVRQRIYFANHTSHLDFVVLWSALPSEIRARTRPIAAKDYWEETS